MDNATSELLIDKLRSINPDAGAPTPEPSLNQIVMSYYRAHFGELEARELTDRYFAELGNRLTVVQASSEFRIPRTVEAYESMARLCERDGKLATAEIWRSNAEQLRNGCL